MTSRNSAAILFTRYFLQDSNAFFMSFCRNDLSSRISLIADSIESKSRTGTNLLFHLFFIISFGSDLQSVETTGQPHIIASTRTLPNPSYADDRTNTSARAIYAYGFFPPRVIFFRGSSVIPASSMMGIYFLSVILVAT